MTRIEIEIVEEEGKENLAIFVSRLHSTNARTGDCSATEAATSLANAILTELPKLFMSLKEEASLRYLESVEPKGEA